MTTIQPPPVVMEHLDVPRELERLHAESWGWALACCARDRDMAEDVLQAAYLAVVSRRARFGGGSSFKTWWFGVIRMTARAERRRLWLWQWRHRDADAAREVAGSTTTDADVERAGRRERLAVALRALSLRQREVVQLVFYHDMTIEQAAAVMHISLGSARTHYDRAKKSLARRLAEENDDASRR